MPTDRIRLPSASRIPGSSTTMMMVGCSVIASASCDRGAATNRMVPISHSGHLKIVGSAREAISTAAVAADGCALTAGRHHSRPARPIPKYNRLDIEFVSSFLKYVEQHPAPKGPG